MLRVLHCIYDDPENPWVGGGGALRVREIYRRLADRVDVTVATGNYPGASEGLRERVRYSRLGVQRPYPLSRMSYAAAATRLLATAEYDVGIFDFSVYTPLRLPADRPVGLVVHMLHGPSAAPRWGRAGAALLRRAEVAALQSARWISTTSQWMERQLEAVVTEGTRIVSVGSGVPAEFTAVGRRESDYLLYYGRLDIYQKGLDTLLAAFAILRAEHPELNLVIAGRGKDASRLFRLVDEMGLREAVEVRLRPDRAAVLELMSGAVTLVMPSRLEGLPMVPAEAMAAGVPVIATEVGAVPEIVVTGVTGLLVPPDDPLALVDAMRRIALDRQLRDRMSSESRRSAERFSWDRVARTHLEFLEAVAGDSGRSVPSPDPA